MHLFAFLDDHSRLIPHTQFYWNQQLPRLEGCLKHAILRCGCPLVICADRGQVYRAGQLDTACATLGIQRILAQPYVSKTSHVHFQGNRYTVPPFLVGQAVELRYDPFDLTTIEVWLNGQYLALAKPAHLLTTIQPGLTPDATPLPPQPTTGVDYLALLRQERERWLQQQLPPIPSTAHQEVQARLAFTLQHHFPALITGDGLP
jgi:hypothetical protein